jgi:NTE family protein
MKAQSPPARPPFACVALLLQGGGALGSYQGGVYQALAEYDLHPDWVAGISIGAINSALIAGNPPEKRVERLRAFWEKVTDASLAGWLGGAASPLLRGDAARGLFNQLSAASAAMNGVPGFFAPRVPSPWFAPPGAIAATSYCDTSALKSTLESLIDFDRINQGDMRFSVGAVNVETGNFAYFDSANDTIRPEHVMASGAIPPGFPAIEIDGQYYWDGGLVSNTPLQWVLEDGPRQDTLAFQVDLWSARGRFPRNMPEVSDRQKEIQYSSRTRLNTTRFKESQDLRNALAKIVPQIKDSLPDAIRNGKDFALLEQSCDHSLYNIVHLIYRAKQYEGDSKYYEFSRLTMEDHWKTGYHDAIRTLRHREAFDRPNDAEGVFTFDFGS